MADRSHIPSAYEQTSPEPIERLTAPFARFARFEAAGGVLLIFITVVAMIWANSRWGQSYFDLFAIEVTAGFGDIVISKPFILWINDALMAIFFFMVGLEIKREILVGELSSPKKAALPIAGAIGGMLVPALFFVALNAGEETIRGWGVPMATDIAFALGLITLAGRRAPLSLRIFLTSLAIVDDIGALAVIAIFYTENLQTAYLTYAGIGLGVAFLFNALRVRWPIAYLLLGFVVWYFVLKSGVHATIAGVAMAMAIPASGRVKADRFRDAAGHALTVFSEKDVEGHSIKTSGVQRAAVRSIVQSGLQVLPPLHRLEHGILPWVAFFIIPLFAFANAGVALSGDVTTMITGKLSLGIIVGLALGKPIGIFLISWIAVKLKLAELPEGVGWRQILAAGCLGGIGFTMALFISNLAFEGADLNAAKIGVLIGSLISTIAGLSLFFSMKEPPAPNG